MSRRRCRRPARMPRRTPSRPTHRRRRPANMVRRRKVSTVRRPAIRRASRLTIRRPATSRIRADRPAARNTARRRRSTTTPSVRPLGIGPGGQQPATIEPDITSRLPMDDRPETGPRKELPPQFRRTTVEYRTREPAGTIIVDTAEHVSLSRARQRPGDALRHRRRPRRLHLDRRRARHAHGRVAGLASAVGDDRAPALPAALHGRRRRQSDGRARALSRQDDLPHPRHQSAVDHRHVRVVGLHPPHQRGRHRPLLSREGRHPRRGAARQAAGDCVDRAGAGRGTAPRRSGRRCRRASKPKTTASRFRCSRRR